MDIILVYERANSHIVRTYQRPNNGPTRIIKLVPSPGGKYTAHVEQPPVSVGRMDAKVRLVLKEVD
jgi:hypothetical protein